MLVNVERATLFCKFNIPCRDFHKNKRPFFCRVPEIGEERSSLFPADLPEFNNFTIENCIASIGHQALDLEKEVKGIEEKLARGSPADVFAEIIDPLETHSAALEATWGVAKTLYLGNSSLMPTKSYLSIHERARKASALKFNSLAVYEALKGHEGVRDAEQKRVVEKYLLEARLNGVAITNVRDKAFLGETLGKLSEKRSRFRAYVEKAVDMFQHNIHDASLMKEFPPHLLQAMAVDPKQPTNSPWKVTLQPYIAKSFLEYCPHHDMKWNLWAADTQKNSGFGEKAIANSALLEEIRGHRQDQAKLLGFKSYADMSMQTKMVGSVENLEKLLSTLLEAARPVQDKEISELVDFAEQNGFKHQFEVYDVPYWRRRHLKATLDYDDEALRDFFPSTQVLSGMFGLAERLFGIKIVERTVTTWDEDVKYFDVFDTVEGAAAKGPIGGFYVDLFSRDEEKILVNENTGWMVGLCNRSLIQSKPLAALIFNFPAPIYGKPSLLSLRDIQVLFFKFGQALQHLLTRASYSDIAGLSGMQWDVVEVAGNLMNNLLYDADTLKAISQHYKTGDAVSDSKIAAIQASKAHLAGFSLCEELYLANLDLQLHKTQDFWLDIVKATYGQHFVFALDKKDAHPCSFLPIMSGDWGAAYFSHLNARLIAADVYSAFEEKKANKEEVGRRFRDTFLAFGGSEQSFRQFRGRDPCPNALLASLNLQQKNTAGNK